MPYLSYRGMWVLFLQVAATGRLLNFYWPESGVARPDCEGRLATTRPTINHPQINMALDEIDRID
jgi:hypothetical protein